MLRREDLRAIGGREAGDGHRGREGAAVTWKVGAGRGRLWGLKQAYIGQGQTQNVHGFSLILVCDNVYCCNCHLVIAGGAICMHIYIYI